VPKYYGEFPIEDNMWSFIGDTPSDKFTMFDDIQFGAIDLLVEIKPGS